MKRTVVFNWKMNPANLKEAEKIFNSYVKSSAGDDFIVAPPFVFIKPLFDLIKQHHYKNVRIASQDVSFEEDGLLTGEISAKMLKSLGVSHVIVGHSERRYKLGESNEQVAKKMEVCQKNKLTPILCVGERERVGLDEAKEFVIGQLKNNLSGFAGNSLVVAYEPVWSIGGGKSANPDRANQVVLAIKQLLAKKKGFKSEVLYGGSVDCDNLDDFVKYSSVDGFLVGSAGLDSEKIKEIFKKI